MSHDNRRKVEILAVIDVYCRIVLQRTYAGALAGRSCAMALTGMGNTGKFPTRTSHQYSHCRTRRRDAAAGLLD